MGHDSFDGDGFISEFGIAAPVVLGLISFVCIVLLIMKSLREKLLERDGMPATIRCSAKKCLSLYLH